MKGLINPKAARERSERRRFWSAEPEPGTSDGVWNQNLEPVTDVTVPDRLWGPLEPEPGTSRFVLRNRNLGTQMGVDSAFRGARARTANTSTGSFRIFLCIVATSAWALSVKPLREVSRRVT